MMRTATARPHPALRGSVSESVLRAAPPLLACTGPEPSRKEWVHAENAYVGALAKSKDQGPSTHLPPSTWHGHGSRLAVADASTQENVGELPATLPVSPVHPRGSIVTTLCGKGAFVEPRGSVSGMLLGGQAPPPQKRHEDLDLILTPPVKVPRAMPRGTIGASLVSLPAKEAQQNDPDASRRGVPAAVAIPVGPFRRLPLVPARISAALVQAYSGVSAEGCRAKLELAAKRGNPFEFVEAITNFANTPLRFEVKDFAKLLVLLSARIPTPVAMIRIALNLAVPPEGQVIPLQAPTGFGQGVLVQQDTNDDEVAECVHEHRLDLAALRGRVQIPDKAAANYFGHFASLLHLEVLMELQELTQRLLQSDSKLEWQGWTVRGLEVREATNNSSKKSKSKLGGKATNPKKYRVVFAMPPHKALSKFRVSPGDAVLLSRTSPLLDYGGEGLVVEVQTSTSKEWEERLIVTFDSVIDTEGAWRIDVGVNRTAYERQFQALTQLITTTKRMRIWDLLLFTPVGGDNVDAWAARMQELVRRRHGGATESSENDEAAKCNGAAAPEPAKELSPVLHYEGREFSGSRSDFQDLSETFSNVELGGEFSVAFTACWHSFNHWSRIIDFGDGPEGSNIFICNKGKTGTLAFHVWKGKSEYGVHVKDCISIGEKRRYLCTITADGCMRVFQDGRMVGKKLDGAAPSKGIRKGLFLGRSHWSRDSAFHGSIEDLKVWQGLVGWDGREVPPDFDDALSPEDRLRLSAAEELAVPEKIRSRARELKAEMQSPDYAGRVDLNQTQRNAVAAGLSRRLTLVQGPPGTGKTHVAVTLLELWSKELKFRPLLATSDSNIAVDNIAEGAQRRGLSVVRVGRPEKITPQLEDIMLEEIFRRQRREKAAEEEAAVALENDADITADSEEDEEMDLDESVPGSDNVRKRKLVASEKGKSAKERRTEDWEAKMAILKEADVICTTTVGAGSDFFQCLRFNAILIDEVAQATELSALVPLVSRGSDRIVLVGDHCQLPPRVCSLEAETRGLSLSLFGRLTAQGLEPFFLDTQFRMHPMIAAFSANEFYQGRLNTGIKEIERIPPAGFDWPTEHSGVAFVHVSGPERRDGESKVNDKEAEKVAEILEEVLVTRELSALEIGVVSPYAAQVRAMRWWLRRELEKRLEGTGADFTGGLTGRRGKEALEIASVDAFQGREKELIIFSAVRSNRQGQVGFLQDWRRLNVMLTRARRGLIVVGDADTLRRDPTWSRWLDWAQESGFVLPGIPSSQTQPHSRMTLQRTPPRPPAFPPPNAVYASHQEYQDASSIPHPPFYPPPVDSATLHGGSS